MNVYHRQMLDLAKVALAEDIGPGDLTSLACLEPDRVEAHIVAKSEGILSGVGFVPLVLQLVDSANAVILLKHDGDHFQPGDMIAKISGFNQTVMTAERTALNFMGHLSGVATLTARFVEKLAGHACQILDTRKTTPGMRLLEKQAVLHGGGTNHRIGLYDMVLIKDNHLAACGSIAKAVKLTREYLTTYDFRQQFNAKPDDIEVEVEVTSEAQLTEAITAGVDRLLLDNQSIESLTQLVNKARELDTQVKLEASGNVTLETVAAIAATGVDFISAGALTHSATSSDFSLLVEPTDA
jgi:nicotinate-nucleotide pyrophosphorylase (carboxylating)